MIESERFSVLCSYSNLEINGKTYRNFSFIWEELQQYILSLSPKTFPVIHGDLCFSNILCGINNNDVVLKLIDPRGSFGVRCIYGDALYDQAKLRHSFEGGYEYIIYDRFHLSCGKDLRQFSFCLSNDNLIKIKSIFNIETTIESKLIEGLIFIGMCARHYDSFNRQVVMYLTGVKLLNEFLEEIK